MINKRTIDMKANDVSAVQALRLFEGGQCITCPVCETVLNSIPTGIAPGTGHIAGLVCPVNTKHFLIYGDDAEVMKKAREGLRQILNKKNIQ